MLDPAIPLQLPFSRSPLDRATERRSDDDFLAAAKADLDARLLLVEGGDVPIDGDRHLRYLRLDDVASDAETIFLGVDETGRPLFALEVDADGDGAFGLEFAPLRDIGASLDQHEAAVALHAVAIAAWQRGSSKCISCGAETVLEEAGHLRRCVECKAGQFPRIDPAVIMLVTDGERCVLGRRPNAPQGRWSTLAGYVEPGESLESAVAREVYEEVGLRVHDVFYRGSQPWPFPASLMVAFEAYAEAGPLRLNEEHLEVSWFTRDAIREGISSGAMMPPGPSSAGSFLIRSWLAAGE